ncbi:MAG: beta-hydroxyacyl-ACP dehydratase [Planctomycetes bacterium]|nr:beta-hydroxyacyl-ACP dehydratase [Planctomycetota bacterium]NOG55562.1 beta-hydroxyacyl-ACP dehydratase [Planctomycetota bacterium]
MEYDPRLLFDIREIDLSATMVDIEEIRRFNKHRGEAEQIDRIVWHSEDYARAVASRLIRDDEWWVAGHVPGNPLLPAVMMVEAAAQVASYTFQVRKFAEYNFVGFTGIDRTKFRQTVSPGDQMYLLVQDVKVNIKRMISDIQGIVDGKLVFETRITGMPIVK